MKKKCLILSMIFVMIWSVFAVNTMAAEAYSFTPTMTVNNSKVASGSEVLVTVKVSNLNVGENGINRFSAYLSYDTEIFETLTESSIEGVSDWKPNYTTGTGKVSLYRPTFLKTDEEIMQISLKTKANLEDGAQGDIKLSTIIVSNSSDEIPATSVSTSVTIDNNAVGNSNDTNPVVATTPNTTIQITPNTNSIQAPGNTIQIGNIPENKVSNINNNTSTIIPNINTNISVNNTTNNINNTNTTNNIQSGILNVNNGVSESEGNIPYTGTDSGALARIIIGIICIGLVLYIKIEKMNKDIK